MFSKIDEESFSNFLRDIRKSSGLTQRQVCLATGLSEETLRRLEKGTNIPSFRTMEDLSSVYKVDVIRVFMYHRQSNSVFKLYEELDQLIISNNMTNINHLSTRLNKLTADSKTNVTEVEMIQFQLLLQGLESTYTKNMDILPETIYIRALSTRHHNFNIKNFKEYSFNHLELKLLLLYAVDKSENQNYIDSNDIMLFIFEEYLKLVKYIEHDYTFMKLIVKVLFTISYNYHCLDQFEDVVFYVDTALRMLLDMSSFYLMHGLYFRKAAALYFLDYPADVYTPFFVHSFNVLQIQGMDELRSIYINQAKKKYHIDYDSKSIVSHS